MEQKNQAGPNSQATRTAGTWDGLHLQEGEQQADQWNYLPSL